MSGHSNANRCLWTEQVCLYAMQALPSGESAHLEAHLALCSECRGELVSLRPVIDSFTAWPTDVLRAPATLQSRLALRIATESGAKLGLPPRRRRSEPDWEEIAAGISCKVLAMDTEKRMVSMLVRLAPGGEYPPHIHAGVEELHLLDGELCLDDRKRCAGDYDRSNPGSSHRRAWSDTGCTCVLITSLEDILL